MTNDRNKNLIGLFDAKSDMIRFKPLAGDQDKRIKASSLYLSTTSSLCLFSCFPSLRGLLRSWLISTK
jgi:hypothetical protein